MRTDLLPVRTSVNWTIAQIPVMQQRLHEWAKSDAYRRGKEPDPNDGGYEWVVAYHEKPLADLIHGDVGAILGALRSALDHLAAVLSCRNRKPPDKFTQFFIRATEIDVNGAWNGAEREQRVSAADVVKLKSLRPYDGGDAVLWHLHQLDIIRKHRRVLSVSATLATTGLTIWGGGAEPYWRRFDDKTVLYRVLKELRFAPNEGNTYFTPDVTISEISLGLRSEPAFDLLHVYIRRVENIIAMFD